MVSSGDSPTCIRLHGNFRRPCWGPGNHGNAVFQAGSVPVGALGGSARAPRGRDPGEQRHGAVYGGNQSFDPRRRARRRGTQRKLDFVLQRESITVSEEHAAVVVR